ncbi:MAG: helix-turn-helix domain-containing protein [Candidatus Kerfeldbacteria bacterium]|nr:helix-turn-helix domain-containing protein [Candidatus Kerfeldbacteria bacterium]
MTFVQRPLPASNTLGERLRQLREESNISLDELGRLTQVAPKYLAAIEQGTYRDMPGQVYARQFVRRYAEVMQTDVDFALNLFDQEYRIVRGGGVGERPLLTPRVNAEWPWWRRHIRIIVAVVVIAVVVVYLGLQLLRLYTPPELTILVPARDITTTETTITVSGVTEVGAAVTINGQDIQVTNNGQFSEQVDLRVGLNTLQIRAIKKHSAARMVTRQVLVEGQP